MKITIESTTQLVFVETKGGGVMARVWEGHTDTGIPVTCCITRIAVPTDNHSDLSQFEKEMQECRAPQMPNVFPLRMIL